MVETITPAVHGGRRSHWGAFLAMYIVGATVSATAFGAAVAGLGALLAAPWGAAGIVMVSALAALYLAREAFGLPIPVPQLRRQVPDWWRTFFPYDAAALLYGIGLGVGFLTYLRHGTLVVVSAAAAASGRPVVGAAMLGPFGLARGLSAIVAMRARTPEDGSAIVGRLARTASSPGWRLLHVVPLVAVLGASLSLIGWREAPGEIGALASAVLVVAFGAAGLSKVVRRRAWRRAVASYGLPASIAQAARAGVPLAELALAALPFLGLASTGGLAALGALLSFSAAIVVGRLRVGRLLPCGCFATSAVRDYRLLLGRNAVLAAAAVLAWREGVDEPFLGSLGIPRGADLAPAGLAVVGLALAAWLGARALGALGRTSR